MVSGKAANEVFYIMPDAFESQEFLFHQQTDENRNKVTGEVVSEDDNARSEESIIIQLEYLSRVNCALQQNNIAVVRSLRITNPTDRTLNHVSVMISSAPEFSVLKELKIDRIAPRTTYSLDSVQIDLNYQFLAELSERAKGSLIVKVSEDAELLREEIFAVEVFAANEWVGADVMPQLLAAFVTPNLEVISRIQVRMTQLLKGQGEDGALEGYQSKKRDRVREIIKVAYHAVVENKINYANPPASFENFGQRIRFADKIFKDRLATCLDLSLLFASILEQCGLSPLILLQQGHAYVGCHLQEESFQDSFIDDLQAIRKRAQLDELIVFESTAVVCSNLLSFEQAEAVARKHLEDENKFVGALDIRQARIEKIRPLPLRRSDDGALLVSAVQDDTGASLTFTPGGNRELIAPIVVAEEETPQSRLQRWQQKLLDLSKRNKLLNFKTGGKAVPVAFHDLPVLEDKLASGASFSIKPSTPILDGTDIRELSQLERQTGENPVAQYLMDEFQHKRLRSSLAEPELAKKLLELFRQAKNDLEESGVGTLFLALGILEWTATDRTKVTYRAPLLLLPVKLERRSVQEGFSLESADEETVINVTLLEMLARDFEMTIPGISGSGLPMDDSGVDVGVIFQLFQQAVKDLSGWEVKKEAWLSCFSFQKFVMWNDLRNRTEDLLRNPIVDHLINHPKEQFDDGIEPVTPEQLDREYSYQQIFCPVSADSSQMSAVLSAANGKTFVLYGPPGTGKSQSITNIIAHCLAVGKKVLFVAEKRAALEVVHKRLNDIGLAPFCLELHSHKTGKQEVMEQFRQVLDYKVKKSPEDWALVTRKLEQAKEQLNGYVKALHEIYPCGLTPYHVFSYLVRHAADGDTLDSVGAFTFKAADFSREEFDSMKSIGHDMVTYGRELPEKAWNEWSFICRKDWSPGWAKEAKAIAQALEIRAIALRKAFQVIFAQLGITDCVQKEYWLYEVADLAGILKSAIPLPARFYRSGWPEFSAQLEEFLPLTQKYEEYISRLKATEFAGISNLCRAETPVRVLQTDGNIFQFSSTVTSSVSAANLPDWALQAAKKLECYTNAVNALFIVVKEIFRSLGYNAEHFTERDVVYLLSVTDLLQAAPELPSEFIGGEWSSFALEAKCLLEAGLLRDHARDNLAEFDLDAVFHFDVDSLEQELSRVDAGLSLLKGARRFGVNLKFRKTLKKNGRKIVYDEISNHLKQFRIYQDSQRRLNSISPDCSRRLGKIWNKGEADWDTVNRSLRWGECLESAICEFAGEETSREQLRKGIGERLSSLPEGNAAGIFLRFRSKWEEYSEAVGELFAVFREDHGSSPDTAGNTLLDELKTDCDNSVRRLGCIDIARFVENVAGFIVCHAEVTGKAKVYEFTERMPFAWAHGRCDRKALNRAVEYGKTLDSKVRDIEFLTPGELNAVRDRLGEILSRAAHILGPDGALRCDIDTLIRAWNDFYESFDQFREQLSVSPEWQPGQSEQFLEECIALAKTISANDNALRLWCFWRRAREKALTAYMDPIVEAVECRELNWDHVQEAIKKRFYEKFIDEVVEKVEVLREFLGFRQDSLVANFRELDDEYAKLTRQIVVAKISESLPGVAARNGDPKPGTELGILKREVLRQSRHKPVRKLLEEIPNMLPRLKPCLLMSPISVAQYLPAAQESFDLVIFDEASQIPPWDAIGAIARGKQLIVCGDPKQLPPTNFFQRQTDESDEAYEDGSTVCDEKSILDECRMAGFHQALLNWHYRSRHESLISFSNYHYYDNRLLTFPAAGATENMGVRFQFVEDGIYDRKKSRTNRKEAAELVDAVVTRLRSPEFAGKSLGIVTFSMSQQTLIEDLLEEERRKFPEIETFFQPDYPEPLFVKNLENVQGDERDIIFFSICYGPDEAGKRFMNFGPLNNEGGERRLNVAVTRAKECTVVFSSIRSDFIDSSKTTKKGPLHLRAFLDYAERGIQAFAAEIEGASLDDYDSVFEEEVADFLRSQGCVVHTQVGCSGYRIDLAIAAPETPGRYILGVECDGASYHSSATARDRDKLRQSVLEKLGWRIARVWSTDWWVNRAGASEALLKEIANATSNSGGKCGCDSAPSWTKLSEPDLDDADDELWSSDQECEFTQEYPSLDDYRNYWEFNQDRTSDEFYEFSSRSSIKKQLALVIEVESPIIQSVLQQRVISAWGIARAGRKVVEVLNSLYPAKYTVSNGERVFWHEDMKPENYEFFRRPTNGYNRKIEEIPVQEIRNAMKWVRKEYRDFSNEDALFKETGLLLGFRRLTEQSKKYYHAALKLLLQEERAD